MSEAIGSFAAAEGLDHAPMGHGLAALATQHRHLGAARRMTADRRIDGAVRAGRGAPYEREIAALELAGPAMVGELLGERAMGPVGLGHHHQPARVLVEAMHDARPRHAADAREALAAMGDQRVDERAGRMAGAGMDHEPRRLVDDDERVVLVDHIERNGLAARLGRGGGRKVEREAVARFDPVFHVNYGRAGLRRRGPV